MLSLLLDQQISPEVAVQVHARRPEISITSVYDWMNGAFVGQAGHLLLRAASDDYLSLVTYDRKTIPPLLAEWEALGVAHGGVVFIDNKTIAFHDFGRLVRALIYYWDLQSDGDWTDRIGFLPVPPT
jgi:hypothetical protein